jgi:hypothetical protein
VLNVTAFLNDLKEAREHSRRKELRQLLLPFGPPQSQFFAHLLADIKEVIVVQALFARQAAILETIPDFVFLFADRK